MCRGEGAACSIPYNLLTNVASLVLFAAVRQLAWNIERRSLILPKVGQQVSASNESEMLKARMVL